MNLKKNPASNWKLYCILEKEFLKTRDPVKTADFLFRSGVKAIQLRYKNFPSYKLLGIAKKIKKLADKYDATLVINDRVDVAAASGFSGVHLGSGDIPISLARFVLEDKSIIGKTIHSINEAKRIKQEKINYVGSGPVFSTPTKRNLKAKGTRFPEEVKENLPFPVFAIGGINRKNVKEVLKRKIDGVCVLRATLDAKGILKEIDK